MLIAKDGDAVLHFHEFGWVTPEDMGQIIGKAGSTARSIRSLVRIVGLKNHARVNLKIEEPEGSTRAPRENRMSADTNLEDLKLFQIRGAEDD